MRAFWTFLTSLLLAVLPAEGIALSVQDADTCSSCRCCVQPNTNPAPARNAPTKETNSTRAERQAPAERKSFVPPQGNVFELLKPTALSDPSFAFPVPLFYRHCALLI